MYAGKKHTHNNTNNRRRSVLFTRRISPSLTKLTNKTPACPSASWSLILQGSTSSLIPYYRGYVKCKHLTLTHFQEEPPHRGGGEIKRIPDWWALSCNQSFVLFLHPNKLCRNPLLLSDVRQRKCGGEWLAAESLSLQDNPIKRSPRRESSFTLEPASTSIAAFLT